MSNHLLSLLLPFSLFSLFAFLTFLPFSSLSLCRSESFSWLFLFCVFFFLQRKMKRSPHTFFFLFQFSIFFRRTIKRTPPPPRWRRTPLFIKRKFEFVSPVEIFAQPLAGGDFRSTSPTKKWLQNPAVEFFWILKWKYIFNNKDFSKTEFYLIYYFLKKNIRCQQRLTEESDHPWSSNEAL